MDAPPRREGGFPAPPRPVKMIKITGKLRGKIKAWISNVSNTGNQYDGTILQQWTMPNPACPYKKNAKNWHTRCARWWNDFNIEHTLNTLWTHSENTLMTLWTHSEHTLNALWTHSEHTLNELWTHTECTQNTLWTHPERTLNTLWTHSEHTLNTLWTRSEHTLNTLWTYSEHTLKICPRFDKISKTLMTQWLTLQHGSKRC